MTKKLTLFTAIFLMLCTAVRAQSISEILTETNGALGTDLLSNRETIQYDLIQKHEESAQRMRITVKGNNKIRVDIQQENQQLSYIRNGPEYTMEVGHFSKEISSAQTKKNLNRQNLIKGLLKVLEVEEGATFEEKTTENGLELIKIKSEEGNRKSTLWINTETWLPTRHREVITRANGKKKITVTAFKNYEAVDGVMLPMKQTIKITMPNGEEFNETYLLSNVKIGMKVSNSFFASR